MLWQREHTIKDIFPDIKDGITEQELRLKPKAFDKKDYHAFVDRAELDYFKYIEQCQGIKHI